MPHVSNLNCELKMLLQKKNAVIYGAGSAARCAFARDGAKGYLSGRCFAKVDAVAKEILAEGGGFLEQVIEEFPFPI